MTNPIQSVLVTGCAGFIGFHLSKRLLNEGITVVGIDNLNDYYEPQLKRDRLQILQHYPAFQFKDLSLTQLPLLKRLFNRHSFDAVIHLAAQAGVRYSLENPFAYIDSNITGFTTMLECCKESNTNHFLYASSSSVYGKNQKTPFSTTDQVDSPVSLYAATKKSNEVIAHAYSHLYQIPTTGLRFFTVYGPFGRPDMAYFTFANKIVKNEPIDLYNYGKMRRDFTYIDDVVEAIFRLLKKGPPSNPIYRLHNIGNNTPVSLEYFVQLIEDQIGRTAKKNYLPLQPGDVEETYADIDDLTKEINYQPTTSIEEGIQKFVTWYKSYYGL